MTRKRSTAPDIRALKGKEKIACVTAYTAPFARILDKHADLLLVGDSIGMVVYGMESTLGVTLDMMIAHGRAVVKASQSSCVVIDLPFGTYQQSPAQAFESAARVMSETGAQAVKLEGGEVMEETIRFLVDRGIPVMGHIGLMPQAFNVLGGYKVQGKTNEEQLKKDALAVERAGAFSVVLEGVIRPVADDITKSLHIPTIGIGASPKCDGQVLVIDDMCGLTVAPPRFAKQFGDVGGALEHTAEAYVKAVKNNSFPAAEHCFEAKK